MRAFCLLIFLSLGSFTANSRDCFVCTPSSTNKCEDYSKYKSSKSTDLLYKDYDCSQCYKMSGTFNWNGEFEPRNETALQSEPEFKRLLEQGMFIEDVEFLPKRNELAKFT